MADSIQKIRRVNQVPTVREANTMYIVKAPGALEADLVFTGSDPTIEASTISRAAINTIVGDKVDASTSIYFQPTYAQMLANPPKANALIYVADTTGDPTAVTPTRVYLYQSVIRQFMGFPNSGGGGTGTVSWDAVLGRPTATPAQIDQAVAQSHAHANQQTLNQLGENAQQKLTFRGTVVDTPASVTFLSTW